jgi:hypothetical protein
MLIGVEKANDGLCREPVAGAIDQFGREMIDAQPDRTAPVRQHRQNLVVIVREGYAGCRQCSSE